MFKSRKKSTYRSDIDAWQDLQKGNMDALGYFYDKYVDDLFAIGYSIYPDKEFIQDVIHDMFLELYKYHDRLSEAQNIKAYLITSFKRNIFRKKNSKEIKLENKDFETKPGMLENTESHENKIINFEQASLTQKKVDHAMEYLTLHQIKVLELKFSEDKSYEEIARDLNVTVSSARTLVYRTVKELRKKAVALLW
ncbi:RNA polymerase sigma factor [Salegentibacter sp. F14]